MMNKFVTALALLTVCSVSCLAATKDAVSYVNPLICTQRSAIGYGGTMPFVTTPFGMTDWTPQTRQNMISVTSYNRAGTDIAQLRGFTAPAEILFNGMGDVFNARVAGNIENPHILGSMEFTTKVAGAKLVLSTGHSACGAVVGSDCQRKAWQSHTS
jgi:putative alpha-1,2-mannosidase